MAIAEGQCGGLAQLRRQARHEVGHGAGGRVVSLAQVVSCHGGGHEGLGGAKTAELGGP